MTAGALTLISMLIVRVVLPLTIIIRLAMLLGQWDARRTAS